ncbi:hypothetical protein ACFLT9_04265 [Acidobacteriota bacterium]
MKQLSANHKWTMFMCSLLGLLLMVSISIAYEIQDDDALNKKYAPILGDYEFDLSGMGGEVIVLKIHVEGGELWGDSGDGKPVTLEPVEDKEFEFTADDPDSGALEIKFVKDDEGNYTSCLINLVTMGVEIEGRKIK